MHFFKKLSLVAFFASIMTILQGCSAKDAATAVVVLFALIVPSCSLGDELEATGAATLSEVLSVLILSQDTRVIPATIGDEIFNVPAGAVTYHIFCARDASTDVAIVAVVDQFANGSGVQDVNFHHDESVSGTPATDTQVRLVNTSGNANTCTVTFRAV